jgi:hypothetical protein
MIAELTRERNRLSAVIDILTERAFPKSVSKPNGKVHHKREPNKRWSPDHRAKFIATMKRKALEENVLLEEVQKEKTEQ